MNEHSKRRRKICALRAIHQATSCCKRLHRFRQTTTRDTTSSMSIPLAIIMLLGVASIAVAAVTSQQIVLLEATNSSSRFNPQASTTTTSTTINQQQQQHQVIASFSTPNQAINITHVTYDYLHDTVYIGATNSIYQLNGSDLSEQFEQTTGPVFDNPSCGITECHGYEDFMKPTQNVNKILVIDYQHKKILSCGSTKQGACRRYQLNNISQKEDLISMAVAANDDNSSTYAFIAPAKYNYDPSSSSSSSSSSMNSSQQQQQQVLYVAATYTKGQSRDLLVPAIGTRILDDGPNLLKLYENSFVDSARVDINSHLRDYFLVNYLYGFASSNFIYFVTLQKKATSRENEELGYHTRLARICITDSSYNSYTEVDLKCMPNKKRSTAGQKHPSFFSGSQMNQQQPQVPTEYPLLQDAILVDAGSHLLQSLAQNDQSAPLSADFFFNNPSSGSASPDDGKVLLGVFSSAKDHTQHAGEHSALCAFLLSQIEDKFNDNIHNCYTGKMQSRNMEYIAGNVQDCPKSGQGGNVVNFCHETLKINGTLPIISEASIQFHNTTLTAIAATSHINSNHKNIYSDQIPSGFSPLNSSSRPYTSIPSSSFNQQQQHTVVFMGTSNGHIKKVLLNNASNGLEFEDVQLDTNPILSDLHLHSSGQQLIVATPYKVMKVPTHNCAQYSTCRECSQSKNPYCGWCSLKRSCTTKSECAFSSSSSSSGSNEAQHQQQLPGTNTRGLGGQASAAAAESASSKQLKWISNESASKCIDLQSIVPDRIPITSTGKVDLYIDRLPKEHSYKCIFDRREQTSAVIMSFGLSCPLPKVMHRPKIQPGRDHAIVDLAVRSSETNTDFLNGKITFFECQLHTTCKDCLTTNWGCNWCLNENICLFNTSKCEKTGQQQQQLQQPQTLLGASASKQQELVQLLVGGRSGATSGGNSPATSSMPPIITISNGASQRSSLSLTSVGGLVGASSLLQASTGRAGNTINQVNQCPTFDVGHKQDILIADGSEKELTIKVKNMPQIKGNIQCIVEIENDKMQLKARIEEDRVICENSTYSYAADVGLLNGQLVVIYSDNNIFVDRTNFTMYKCHLLGAYLNRPDCSLCQRIDKRFNCVWCSGACHHKSRCSEPADDTCPAPRIDYIYPLSGPVTGGTRVSIEGSNLGQSFEEIANRVTIGNIPCRPIEEEYKPSNKIVCVTGALVSRYLPSAKRGQQSMLDADGASGSGDVILGDVMVGNKAGYSIGQNKFQFKGIYLRDHQPRYGPQSGGTRITLTGMNLNIGSSVQVFLDDLACLVEPQLLTSEQIVCKTSASRHASRAIKQLRLIIDDAHLTREDDVFYYTQDPVITRIFPLRSYLSGGRPINVFGTNLTSVQMPKLAILDATGKKVNESSCILQDDTRMQCPSPTVNLPMMDLEWSEQHIGQYEPQTGGSGPFSAQAASSWTPIGSSQQQQQATFQQDESVKFKLSFIMDNVWRLRDLQSSLPDEIAYTSDPKLYPFASAKYKGAQEQAMQAAANEQSQQQQLNPAYPQAYQIDSDTYLLQPGEPILVLYGEHLRAAVSEYEITVTVGQDLCNLTQLSQAKLVCLMPLDHMATPTDEEGHQTQRALPLVVVRIGFNLRYELGYVQYHPMLVEQIVQTIANMSNGEQLPYMRPTYPQYMPRENESLLHKISSCITTALLMFGYLVLGSLLLVFLYSSLTLGYKCVRRGSHSRQEYRRIQSKLSSLEKSVRGECRLASLSLQSDLNELVRHVDLSGIPLLDVKHYIMKVFFPGINNHPILLRQASQQPQQAAVNSSSSSSADMMMGNGARHHQIGTVGVHQHLGNMTLPDATHFMMQEQLQQQQQQATLEHSAIQRPLSKTNVGNDFPMEYFERLIFSKPFLVTFINTLEAQPSFSIRDKVNVGSLLMIILMERLDYATDILRTLLFQLVERSVSRDDLQRVQAIENIEAQQSKSPFQSSTTKPSSRFTRKASNLLSGLPISVSKSRASRAGSGLGKVVGGSASSLMASTTVAAQMLLSRVGNKTSPLQPNHQHSTYLATGAANNHHHQQQQLINGGSATMGHCMSTTAFNNSRQQQRNNNNNTVGVNTIAGRTQASRSAGGFSTRSGLASGERETRSQGGDSHLMLRRTDSVVEKMLTNWLALNMYDYFQGNVGQSLYMMFEALKCQLDRGPIDSVSGDAYYSLNEHKLLREPHIQFEVVNLYIIVDTDILQPTANSNNNLLLDSTNLAYNINHHQGSPFFDDLPATEMLTSRRSPNYATSNTITLALRVLDCDTISQVKGKILNALYRNSPHSCRLGVNDVDLSLRQQQQAGSQYNVVSLFDEDYTSLASFNGMKRVNTLRHYGITDQAIMMLNRSRAGPSESQRAATQTTTRTALTDMLDEHYNNPYSEIQYGPANIGHQLTAAGSINQHHQSMNRAALSNSTGRAWHLVDQSDQKRNSQHFGSNDSSPSSHSPSMMLLGNENNNSTPVGRFTTNQQQQQQYYHPSSSSTSSTGNVMDTNSTSANSSSMNVTNLLKSRNEQPIYCQIGSATTRSQHGGATSSYYCQIGANNTLGGGGNNNDFAGSSSPETIKRGLDREQERHIYLTRMLTSKGTIQNYVDDFFKTILSVKPPVSKHPQAADENSGFNTVLFGGDVSSRRAGNQQASQQKTGACPPAVKWLFDLLDEAALENGIADQDVIHSWKSNAFLLRFWVNFIKNPNYILDVDKSNTMDSSLSVVAQTLMDSCSVKEQTLSRDSSSNKLLFAKDVPRYRGQVKRFYQDIATMRPVSDKEIVEQMGSLSMANAGQFDTNLALKELCVYAVNYGVEIMNALNNDFTCQQLDLSQQLEQCFRSFTLFEAYR